MTDWSQHHTKEELYRLAQAKRIPVTAVYTMDEVVQSRQLAVRGLFTEIDHPVAGPICTKYLAIMGTEVIRIETRRRPDVFRVRGAPFDTDGQREPYEVMEILQAVGVPAGPSVNAEELVKDLYMRERGVYLESDHPEVGKKLGYSLPWPIEPSPSLKYAPPPLGKRNDYVFLDLLGMVPEEVQRLRDESVIY